MTFEIVVDGAARAILVLLLAILSLPVLVWLDALRAGRTPQAPGVAAGARGAPSAVAMALKLLEKRAPRVPGADPLLHTLAPALALVPTLSVFAVLPVWSDDRLGTTLPFLLGLPLLSTCAIALAGFAGGNRLALLSALRFVALRASVLVVLLIAALAVVRATGSLEMREIVAAQARTWGVVPRWGLLVAPLGGAGAILALALQAQQVMRARLEPSLAEPWTGDATGPVLLGHRAFETLDVLASASIVALVFLGGWDAPLVDEGLAGIGVTIGKMLGTLGLVLFVRNRLPPISPAGAIRACWLLALPLALLGVAGVEILS